MKGMSSALRYGREATPCVDGSLGDMKATGIRMNRLSVEASRCLPMLIHHRPREVPRHGTQEPLSDIYCPLLAISRPL